MQIHGYFYDGQSSRRRQDDLQLYDDGSVALGADGGGLRTPLEKLTISSRLGSTPRQLRFPDGGLFETTENDAVDHWLKENGSRSGVSLFHRLESKPVLIVPLILLAIAGSWLFLSHGLPALAKGAAYSLSPSVLDTASEETLGLLDEYAFEASELTEARKDELREQFSLLTVDNDEHQFQLEFRKGGEFIGANAFALPSGTIVVTDELVALAEHDEEILGVMSHEVGHVVHRHGLRQVLQGSVLTLGALLVTGDADSLLATVPALLVTLGYSRDFEREADRYAEVQLAGLGIDSEYLDSMLLRLEQEHAERAEGDQEDSGFFYYLSTHPPTRERVAE